MHVCIPCEINLCTYDYSQEEEYTQKEEYDIPWLHCGENEILVQNWRKQYCNWSEEERDNCGHLRNLCEIGSF